MLPAPALKPETELEEHWFVEPAPISTEQPIAADPELDGEWFAKGRPLSSRPPPPDAKA
jgi:hypothetical protein